MFPGRICFFKAVGDPVSLAQAPGLATNFEPHGRRRRRKRARARSFLSASADCRLRSSGFAKMIERARCQAGLAVLRHATGYALANEGVDAGTLKDTWATLPSSRRSGTLN
jgi:hypothetical protein